MRPVLRSVSRRGAAFAQLLLFVFSLSTSLLPCSDARAAGVTAHHTSPPAEVHHGSHDVTPAPEESSVPGNETSCPLMIACGGIVQFADDLEWRSVVSSTPTDAPTGLVLARASADLDVDSPPPRR
jgi:hypothetical protein